jgi:Recombination endonuclease VII
MTSKEKHAAYMREYTRRPGKAAIKSAADKDYRKRHPEIQQRKVSKAKLTDKFLKWYLWSAYRITLTTYYTLWAACSGICPICGKHMIMIGRKPNTGVVDHDHKTGEVRGIICLKCNAGLGHVEKLNWLPKALFYLENYRDMQPSKC